MQIISRHPIFIDIFAPPDYHPAVMQSPIEHDEQAYFKANTNITHSFHQSKPSSPKDKRQHAAARKDRKYS